MIRRFKSRRLDDPEMTIGRRVISQRGNARSHVLSLNWGENRPKLAGSAR